MNKRKLFLLLVCLVLSPIVVIAESLLTAQTFPKTFDDVSFMERIQILEAGYNDFEMEFDADGYCISGCPYPGIKFEEVEKDFNEADNLAASDMQQLDIDNETETNLDNSEDEVIQEYNNSNNSSSNSSNNGIPVGLPLHGTNKITSCFKKRWGKKHTGLDIGGTLGTPIYATGAGTVEIIWTICKNGAVDRCGARGYSGYGNIVLLKHNNDYKTLYAHLNTVTVRQGQFVAKGEQVGTLGNTGKSYGSHLHYEIRRRINSGRYVQINPYRVTQQGYQMVDNDSQCKDNAQQSLYWKSDIK